MKGIYLTEEAKKEIEAKIAELEVKRDEAAEDGNEAYANNCIGQIFAYYEILSLAVVLPIENSWEDVNYLYDGVRKELFPNGLIIQPKQE